MNNPTPLRERTCKAYIVICMDRSICIFGDSVTQADYINENYVELLRKHLEKKYPKDYIQVYNLGISGNTTDDVLKRFEFEASIRKPTDILFQVGVNDSGYFEKEENVVISQKEFEKNIERLIDKAKDITPHVTFIGLVLGDENVLQPFNNNPYDKWFNIKRTTAYNNIIKNLAGENSCKYIHLLDKLSPSDFLDGLHPNQNGHINMFEDVKKYF